MTRASGEASGEEVRVVPADQASWSDLQKVLTGTARQCQCERQRLGDGDWWHMPVDERMALFRSELGCDDPRSTETIGVVAYAGDEPVGWCAVDRRSAYARLRNSPVPWKGRAESKDDDSVWAITCLIVRPGYRGRGLSYPLISGAVAHARRQGASAVEGYPMLTGGGTVTWGEMNVGAIGPFAAAGFSEASRPTVRRVVMRLDL